MPKPLKYKNKANHISMETAEGKDADLLNSNSPEPKKRSKPLLWIIVLVVVAVAIGLGFAFLQGAFTTSPSPSSTQTWQQYGMSISYPSGLQAQTKGVFEQQATSSSGMVYWLWDQNSTELALTWVNTTTYDIDAGLQALYTDLSVKDTNVTLISQGNMTIDGEQWSYLTYGFIYTGHTYYQSTALSFYSSEGRAYEIDFVDTNSGTLANLTAYANTFVG
jgi:flagellar basal body-associated protein FliL